ncbi:unnamed protein product [Adineta ricciae]|uniref:NAD(P)(+)--arginine ADP-ribosyltransferase n=1 Tax=Adineta ricciae TaxID=249248 RepID=A0A814TWF3_ADIRI|nr:unnamed protein product [Adineta ricciae]CAF1531501.1 unnamed protein product [Adineta ricciae]
MGNIFSTLSASVNDGPFILRRDLQPNDAVKNLENVALIWLDSYNNISSPNTETTLSLLQVYTNFVVTYTDPQLCVDYIKYIEKEKVVLVVSGALCRNVLPDICHLPAVDSVLIYCKNRQLHEQLRLDYAPKVANIVTDHETLEKALNQQFVLLWKQAMVYSFFNEQQKSTKELTKDAAAFLWAQMMLAILKQLPQTADSKKQLLNKCRDYYRGNPGELAVIDEFQKDYQARDAVAWYTKECFIYRLLNKALRTENIDALYLFRFYIIDLCKQLEEESQKNRGVMTLYRGQVMSTEELDRLKRNVGTLFSMNGFFSTTRTLNVAKNFLESSRRDGLQPVLFEITADSNIRHVVFADIEQLSNIDGEDEVLFSIGSVFKIESVEADETLNCSVVKMVTSDEGTISVHEYIETLKKEYEGLTNVILFGRLLTQMGEYNKAEDYFNFLLQNTRTDSLEEADIRDEIGHIFNNRSQTVLAMEHYKRSLEIREKWVPHDDFRIGRSSNNQASIFAKTNENEKALLFYLKAYAISVKNHPQGHLDTATVLSNIADVYVSIKDFVTGMDFHIQSLDMRLSLLPKEHSTTALSIRKIGTVFYQEKDYDRARQQYNFALNIYQKTLPVGHPSMNALYSEIVNVHMAKQEHTIAFTFCEEKLDELRQTVGETHVSVGKILYLKGTIYQDENQDDEALIQYEYALKIYEKCIPPEQEHVKSCCNNIAQINYRKNNFIEALELYKKALEIARKIYLPVHPEIANMLMNIGSIYLKIENYEESISHLKDALGIFHKKLIPVQIEMQTTQALINEARILSINKKCFDQ